MSELPPSHPGCARIADKGQHFFAFGREIVKAAVPVVKPRLE
jgi:hypothetical protein